MTTHPTIVPRLNRESTAQGTNDLVLILSVAAFVLGVAMVSQGVLLSQTEAHLRQTTPPALGRVERLVPTRGEHRVAMPVTSAASRGGTSSVAVCTARRALECDLRLGLMEMALQQQGFFLDLPDASYEQHAPWKYRALASAETAVTPAAPPSLATP